MPGKLRLDGHLTIREQYARAHADEEILRVINSGEISSYFPVGDGDDLPELPDIAPGVGHEDVLGSMEKLSLGPGEPKVAIVGAGVAGLFLGMMLDYLNDNTPAFNVSYDIFEANTSDRVGGRLFTYNFKPKLPDNP